MTEISRMVQDLREKLESSGLTFVTKDDREIQWLISDIQAEAAHLTRELERYKSLSSPPLGTYYDRQA